MLRELKAHSPLLRTLVWATMIGHAVMVAERMAGQWAVIETERMEQSAIAAFEAKCLAGLVPCVLPGHKDNSLGETCSTDMDCELHEQHLAETASSR